MSLTKVTYSMIQSAPANVLDFGAVGDGVADDTAAIQAAIDTRLPVYLPKGKYRVTSTLQYPTSLPGGGCQLYGDGPSFTDALLYTPARNGNETVIYWDGPNGGTLLNFDTMIGAYVCNLTFCGKLTTTSANVAGKLVFVNRTGAIGSGTHSFQNVSFHHATTGIQFGNSAADTNCDTTSFINVQFFELTTGFNAVNNQALGFNFTQVFATNCNTVWNFERGGCVTVRGAYINGCGGVGATDYCIRIQNSAANTSTYQFDSLRIEGGTKQLLDANGYGFVTFTNFLEAQSNQLVTMVRSIGMTVTFRDSRFVTTDATNRPFYLERQSASGFRSSYQFLNCVFDGALPWVYNNWFEVSSTTIPAINLTSCFSAPTMIPIPDFNTQINWKHVSHQATTTDATPKYAYLDGASSASASNMLYIPTDTAWVIDAFVVAKEPASANSAYFSRRFLVVNNADVVTIVGATETIGTDNNAPSYGTPSFNANLQYVRALVTGKAATTVDWTVTYVGRRVKVGF